MNINVNELFKEPKRGEIRYIFPGENEKGIAKLISSLATSGGGALLLGVEDDGNMLNPRGYAFAQPRKSEIIKILHGFDNFSIEEIEFKNRKFFLVEVVGRSSGVSFQEDYYVFIDNFNNEMRKIEPVKIFISYNHLVFKLADIIEKELNDLYGPKIKITRDTQLTYRQDIDEFMKSIKTNDLIISLVSNTYLKSEACMFEISELMRDSEYAQRLAYIILSKQDEKFFDSGILIDDLVPKIYNQQRFNYLKYWTDVRNEYVGVMDNLRDNYYATVELNERIRRTAIISQGIGAFIELLNRLNGQDFSTMYNSGFVEIIKLIDVTFKEKNNNN